MMNDIDKKNYIINLSNIKFLKYTNKLINKKINSDEDYKDYKKRSIISAVVGALGVAISATVLPMMLPLALPFMITGSIVGGMAGLVGLSYSFLSLNCVGKMRQMKQNEFAAESSLKKLHKQSIKKYKKTLKDYSKKDIKNNFNKKELKELKKLIKDTEITALKNIMENNLDEIRSELAATHENEANQNVNCNSAENDVNNNTAEQNIENNNIYVEETVKGKNFNINENFGTFINKRGQNMETVVNLYGNIDINDEPSVLNDNEKSEVFEYLEELPHIIDETIFLDNEGFNEFENLEEEPLIIKNPIVLYNKK